METKREKYLKYRREEINEMKDLYESVINLASHGLFYRTGQIMGRRIAKIASENSDYFNVVKKILIDECWVDDINIDKNGTVMVKGSIEVTPGKKNTCHLLRGVLSKIFEEELNKKIYCEELECEGAGAKKCVFRVEIEKK